MQDPKHPIWPLLRFGLRIVAVGLCLAFVYKQVDARDLMTLAIFALSDGAISNLVKPKEVE